MSSPPTLRPLARADRDAIEAMVRGTERFPESEIAVAMELVDGPSGDPGGYLFVVAERDGAPVGYACWGRATMSQGVFDLYWIVVDRRAQGGGIGRALLAHVERDVKGHGGHTVLIETEGGALYDDTRRFYEKAGYALAGRIADFYGRGKDKLLYTRRIDG